MGKLTVSVITLMVLLGGIGVDLSSAQVILGGRLEGVSEYDIAEWQVFYGRGPLVHGAWVPMYAAPAMPPPWVQAPPAKRKRPATPCKKPLW